MRICIYREEKKRDGNLEGLLDEDALDDGFLGGEVLDVLFTLGMKPVTVEITEKKTEKKVES